MASNNQSTPVPEEHGAPAEGQPPPQLAEFGSQAFHGPEIMINQTSSIVLQEEDNPLQEEEIGHQEGPTELRNFQDERQPLQPSGSDEDPSFFDSQDTIPDRYAVPNPSIPSQFVPGPNPLFELQAQPRRELPHAWPNPQSRTDLHEGRDGQDQVRFARNDTPSTMRGELFSVPFSADSRPDFHNQSYQSPVFQGDQGNLPRPDTPYPGIQWTDHNTFQQAHDGTQPPPAQPPAADSPPPGQSNDSPRWEWPNEGDRNNEPADGDYPGHPADWGDNRTGPEANLNHPSQPHTEGPAAALIRCTKQVFRNSESIGDVPLFIVCLTVAVRLTDPLFHKHMKYPHTPQQALETLSRISFYKDAMSRLLTASSKTGKPIRDEFDKFIASIGMGQGLSIPLTVTVLGLTLCRTRESPKYARVNDVIQSWLICEAFNLPWLLQKLQAGLVPAVMLPDNVIPNNCPGLIRLRSPNTTERDQHFTHLYICIYAGCCYTAQSEKNALAALAVWKAVSDYKQQRNEEFIFLIDRERSRYRPVIEVCREHALDPPTSQERILNLERLTWPDLFTAVEDRLRFLNQPMLAMGWEQVLEEILAEERRRAEPTIKQQLQLTQPQPSSRFDRNRRTEQTDRQPAAPRERERKPFQQRQKPTMAPAAAGTTDGGCPNHPGAPHSAAECRVADPNGVCYRFLAGECTYEDCKYKHDESAKTPGAIRKASEKVNGGRMQQKPKAFPMTTPSSTPASAALNQQPRCFPITASACTEGTQVDADDDSSDAESVVSTSTPKKTYLLSEKEKNAADRHLFALYGEKPAQEQDDAAAAEGLQDLHCHQPVDEYAGRCIVVEGSGQVKELISNMKIDMDPLWMMIVRLPDSRHAIVKIMPEEPVSALQNILSMKVQALNATEPHQLRLVVRGRQLDYDVPVQESGLTNCSLMHLVMPHWGGGRSDSGKELRAKLSPAQSRTCSEASALEEGEIDQREPVITRSDVMQLLLAGPATEQDTTDQRAVPDQVDEIACDVDGIVQAYSTYMTQRNAKRRRSKEDLLYDPEVASEIIEPVSKQLRTIMQSARTNLAAATLETVQVMQMRLNASHAVEDAAVAFLEQLEEKQKANRRELWLQVVHSQTLEMIIDEWKSAVARRDTSLQHPEVKDTTDNVLRDDADCPGQASANHKGDHPTEDITHGDLAGEVFVDDNLRTEGSLQNAVRRSEILNAALEVLDTTAPAAGEVFVMTPTCALTWCEHDAAWQQEEDQYAQCCCDRHRIRFEQEAAQQLWERKYMMQPKCQDDRRIMSPNDAACPGQAAANHKGDHPAGKEPDKRFNDFIRHMNKKKVKHQLSLFLLTAIAIHHGRGDWPRMWYVILRHFNMFIDRCDTRNRIQLWNERSDPMPELELLSEEEMLRYLSPASTTNTTAVSPEEEHAKASLIKKIADYISDASDDEMPELETILSDLSSSDEEPSLAGLEILKRTAREHYKECGGALPKQHPDTMQEAMQGYEFYNGWPRGAASPTDIAVSSAGIFGWARAMRRWSFRGNEWCDCCGLPNHACSCETASCRPVAFPCKMKFDDRQTTLDKFLGCERLAWMVSEDAPAYQMTALHSELAELTGDAENWMKRTSSGPNCGPCMSPMRIRENKRMRRVPKLYTPEETSAEDDFTTSSSQRSDLSGLKIMPTLTVEVPQLGWTCWKCEEPHPCRQSDQMNCSACGSSHQKDRSLETFIAWLEAYGLEYMTQRAAAPGSNITLVMPTHNGRRLTECEPQEHASAVVQLLFQQMQTVSAEMQMHIRGDYSNSMLLMTPWESVHHANDEVEVPAGASPEHEGWKVYDQQLQCINCGSNEIVCPNLLCIACCEMEPCDCLSVLWNQNPTKIHWLDTAKDPTQNSEACEHPDILCPNGWILSSDPAQCRCSHCGEEVCLTDSCEKHCGCQQWFGDPTEDPTVITFRLWCRNNPDRVLADLQTVLDTTGNVLRNDADCPGQASANHKGDHPKEPILLAMRAGKDSMRASEDSPPRYTPVQQSGDEMSEGELEQEQGDCPYGAESENSPLLPVRLEDEPMLERCANPDTGSVHVLRHSRSLQRTVRQPQRQPSRHNPCEQQGGSALSPSMRAAADRNAQYNSSARPNRVASPRQAIGYQKRGAKTAVVHLMRDCRYIKRQDVVEVRLRDQKVCLVCSDGVPHTGNVRATPSQRTQTGRNNRPCQDLRPPRNYATNTTQSVDHIADQLQNLDLNMNGIVTLNASVTTTSPAQTARTLHALSATGADVSVTLTTKPTKDATAKQTHTCIMCPIMMPMRGNYAEMLGTIVHVGNSDNPISVVAAFDTLAEVSVVSADMVDASAKRTPGVEDTPVWGVGQGSSPLVGEFKISTRFRWGAQINDLSLRKDNGDFMQQLRGLKMVIGIPTLISLGAQIDLAARQIRLEALQLTLELEPVGDLVARLACRPIRALSLCGGGEFCYYAMRDAGLPVETWDCVELDKDARTLATALVPQANHISPHDITRVDADIIINGNYDLVILTSPCQPFSVLPTDPKGWDDTRSIPLVIGSAMIRTAIEAGKNFFFI